MASHKIYFQFVHFVCALMYYSMCKNTKKESFGKLKCITLTLHFNYIKICDS